MKTTARAEAGMRILVVHNRYRSAMPSGENRVVDDEVQMLRDAGLVVETFFRDSDDLASFGPLRKAGVAISPTYSVEAVRAFRRALATFRPVLVHLHNPFPLISPWVVRVATQAGIPVVQTVHNYRMSCLAGTHFREGNICEDCTGKAFPWPAVQHGCYRGSRAQSLAMAVAARAHRSTWDLVDRFLPVSEFVADKLVEAGVPPEKITVKYNSVADPGPPAPLGRGFVFAARLDPEKGVRVLLDAWELSGLGDSTSLTIAGDGPLRDAVERAAEQQPGVIYLGPVSRARVGRELTAAHAAVVASTWYEGLPTLAIEALATGRPVIASPFGALPQLLTRHRAGVVTDGTARSLADALRSHASANAVADLASQSRTLYQRLFAPPSCQQALGAIYQSVTAQDHRSRGANHGTTAGSTRSPVGAKPSKDRENTLVTPK